MSYPVLKLIVRGMLLASVAVLVAARVVDYTTALAVPGDVVAIAWWTTAWPVVVCVAYVLIQGGLPGGRQFVSLPGSSDQDAWLLTLVLAAATPSTTIGQAGAGGFFATRDAVRLATFASTAGILIRALQLRLQLRGGRPPRGGVDHAA